MLLIELGDNKEDNKDKYELTRRVSLNPPHITQCVGWPHRVWGGSDADGDGKRI